MRFYAPRMALPLLAVLLLNRTRALGREQLATQFWPDDDMDTSRANLRRNIHILTSALPPARRKVPWICVTRDQVQWNPEADLWFDVDEFERLRESSETLEAAVALYRGDLLETFAFPWVLSERERLKELCIGDLLHLLGAHRRDRDFGAAARAAKRALALDPWRESVLRQLMLVHFEAGNGAAALAEYESFAARVRSELHAEPMADTRALRDEIASGKIASCLAVQAPQRARTASSATLPFVGRTREIDELRRWWIGRRPESKAMLLTGGAGVGKSRLSDEFSALVAAQGGRVLTGGTSSPESIPYQSIVLALNSVSALINLVELPGPVRTFLGHTLPQATRLSARSQALVNDDARSRLFDAITVVLKQLARSRPVLVILEDIQWAGESTFQLLTHLVSTTRAERILFLLTCREGEHFTNAAMRGALRALDRESLLSRLALEPLGREDVEKLVRSALGEQTSFDVAAQLFNRSEGNALFLQQSILAIRDGKTLAEAGIENSIRGRIADLSPAARALAEMAAVFGVAFDVDAVQKMSGWTLSQIVSALDELVNENIVAEYVGYDGLTHRFTHQLLQACAYEASTRPVRAARHRRAASIIALTGDERAHAELARHFDMSGDPATAILHYVEAAEHAASLAADDEALRMLDRAFQLDATGEPATSALLLRERIYERSGKRDLQRVDLAHLQRVAERNGDDALLYNVLLRRCIMLRSLGEASEEESVRELRALAETSENPVWLAGAYRVCAARELALGHYDDCDELGRRALTLSEQAQDPEGQALTLAVLLHLAAERADRDAVDRYVDALSEHRDRGNSAIVIYALFVVAHAVFMRQDFPLYRDLSREGVKASRTGGDSINECRALNALGIALTRMDEFDEARRVLSEAHDIASRCSHSFTAAASLQNLGLLDWRLGRFTEAETRMRDALDALTAINHPIGQAVCHMNISGIIRNLGRLVEASSFAEQALTAFRDMAQPTFESGALLHLAIAQRLLGDHAQSLRNLRHALKVADSTGRQLDRTEVMAELALTHLYAGEQSEAMAAVDELIAMDPEQLISTAWWPQKFYWVISQVFAAAGQRDEAFAFACRARGIAVRIAEKFLDETDRRTFLTMPLNLDIATAVNDLEWPLPRHKPVP